MLLIQRAAAYRFAWLGHSAQHFEDSILQSQELAFFSARLDLMISKVFSSLNNSVISTNVNYSLGSVFALLWTVTFSEKGEALGPWHYGLVHSLSVVAGEISRGL